MDHDEAMGILSAVVDELPDPAACEVESEEDYRYCPCRKCRCMRAIDTLDKALETLR